MYVFQCFDDISAIRKPKIVAFSKTGSKIILGDFVVSIIMKRYTVYLSTTNNTTLQQTPAREKYTWEGLGKWI